MATRSAIGIEQPDGTVIGIYCHWDGYLDHNGRILVAHYSGAENAAKRSALMELGDLSSLREEIGEKHDFDGPAWGTPEYQTWRDRYGKMCLAYGRDRGEQTAASVVYPNRQAFQAGFRHSGIEYFYLWSGNQWLYDTEEGWSSVELELENQKAQE